MGSRTSLHGLRGPLRAGLRSVLCTALGWGVGVLPAAHAIDVPGARYVVDAEAAVGEAAASELRRPDARDPIYQRIELEPVADWPLPATAAARGPLGTPLLVGFHREMPAGVPTTMGAVDFDWEPAPGGQVATFSVRSPDAAAVRLAIDFHRMPPGSEVRYYAPAAPARAMGPYRPAHGHSFWSPVVAGDEVAVELFVPGELTSGSVSLTVRELSHMPRHPLDGRDLRDVGASGPCEKDVACTKRLADAARSVAKIVFESDGGTFLCTGQLINDTDPETFKPFFSTAGHCISKKREARSASFFWLFQRAACNGADPTGVTQTGGGAKLKLTTGSFGNGGQDFTLLKLNRMPPGGVSFGGWRAREPADEVGKRIYGIHHPAGDVKMASRGKILELVNVGADGVVRPVEPYTHFRVKWNRGVTEQGSSGSAIWAGRKWPKQFTLGVLTGGFASCDDPRAPDFYGIFAEVYRQKKKLRRLLNPAAEAGRAPGG